MDAARRPGLAHPHADRQRRRARPHDRPAVPPDPAVLAVRRRHRRSLPEAPHPGPHAGRHGGDGRDPRPARRDRARPGVARVRARLPVRHGHGVRRPATPGLRQRDGRPRSTGERRRPQLGVVQPRPHDRPGARRPVHRLDGLRRRSDRLGDPGERRQLPGGHPLPVVDAHDRTDADGAARPGARPARRRAALRALPTRPDARDGDRVLRRHVRVELPDDDGADGDGRLRQGRRRVRRARLDPGHRIARRLAARRSAGAATPAARHRGGHRLRRDRCRGRADADLPDVRPDPAAVRVRRAHRRHGCQRPRPDDHGRRRCAAG